MMPSSGRVHLIPQPYPAGDPERNRQPRRRSCGVSSRSRRRPRRTATAVAIRAPAHTHEIDLRTITASVLRPSRPLRHLDRARPSRSPVRGSRWCAESTWRSGLPSGPCTKCSASSKALGQRLRRVAGGAAASSWPGGQARSPTNSAHHLDPEPVSGMAEPVQVAQRSARPQLPSELRCGEDRYHACAPAP